MNTKLHFGFIATITTFALFLACPARGTLTLFGPTPYRSFADSPFVSLTLSQFYLDDFERGFLSMPGVTATSNTPGRTLGVAGPGPFEDSVDGDDGLSTVAAQAAIRLPTSTTNLPIISATHSPSIPCCSDTYPLM